MPNSTLHIFKIYRVELCTELFYAIIPTLFLCFLLICYPYIVTFLMLFFYSCKLSMTAFMPGVHAIGIVCLKHEMYFSQQLTLLPWVSFIWCTSYAVVYGYFISLSLDSNSLTDNGAGMLADALKVNQSMQNLRSVPVIHNRCNAFTPGVHAIGILCLMCVSQQLNLLSYHGWSSFDTLVMR